MINGALRCGAGPFLRMMNRSSMKQPECKELFYVLNGDYKKFAQGIRKIDILILTCTV